MKTGKLIKKSNKPSTKENKIPDKLFTSFCYLLNLLLTIPNYNVFELSGYYFDGNFHKFDE